MCTATWLREESGYRVLFNRDELRSRSPATPPTIDRRDGVRFLAPRDSEAGGAWLAANEWGLTIGLLNLYRVPTPPEADYTSRGLLVLDAVTAATGEQLEDRLMRADLSVYRPCTLFAVEQDAAARVWDWDGRRLSRRAEAEERLPLTSSALEDHAAGVERRLALDRLRRQGPLTAAGLLDFQRSHRPGKGPLSVCMHRLEAATVSLSVVEVEEERVRMLYGDGPACTAILTPGPELPRRR